MTEQISIGYLYCWSEFSYQNYIHLASKIIEQKLVLGNAETETLQLFSFNLENYLSTET